MTTKLATVSSASTRGIDGFVVRVEVFVGRGLPAYNIVGLPDAAVRESRERVSAALQNLGYEFPPRRLTINLAPAGVRKAGPAFDLPIALGILLASRQIRQQADLPCAVVGELALDGSVRAVRGALCLSVAICQAGLTRFIVPEENAGEAALATGVRVHGVGGLEAAVELLGRIGRADEPRGADPDGTEGTQGDPAGLPAQLDLSDVQGQERAKRALQIAAVGGHHLLLVGPPGSGKTMLARRLPTLLPPLTQDEAIDVTKVASVAGLLGATNWIAARPFRAPHHTVSLAGMAGGGQPVRPGEISLAHHGVLFLDELPEFRRSTLEVLRQPVEEGVIRVVRASGTIEFPARFQLVAALNPCPCGFRGDAERECRCGEWEVQRYLGRVSGPLLDRIDLHVEVGRLGADVMLGGRAAGVGDLPFEPASTGAARSESDAVRQRVVRARQRSVERLRAFGIGSNAEIGPERLHQVCALDHPSRTLLAQAMTRLGFTARACHRALRVARSIADLEACDRITETHVAEAVMYRVLDRAADRAGEDAGIVGHRSRGSRLR